MEQSNPSQSASPELERLRQAVANLEQRVAALESHAGPIPLLTVPKPTTEARFGLTAVNAAGAVTLAIGIVFFFKYAVDNEWIGATGRVVLGLLGGLLFIAAAEWLRRRSQQAFAQGIAGCGLAILYISLYAAFAFYRLIPQPAAFLALIAASALAVVLSLRYTSAPIAALGLAGALRTPVLLHSGSGAGALDFGYFLLLDLAAIVLSLRQRWSFLITATAAWTVISAAYLLPQAIWFVAFTACVAALHFAAALSVRGARKDTSQLYISAHGALLVAGIRLIALWASDNVSVAERASFISIAGSLLIGLYGIAVLATGIARRSTLHRAIGLSLLGLVIAKLYLYDVWLLTRFYRISSFVVLGVLLLSASYVYSRFKRVP